METSDVNMNLKQAISLLADEILYGRLVIFLGAGCPMGAGLPSWDKMINGLIDKYSIQTKEVSLINKAKRIEDKIGALKLREEIAGILETKPDVTTELYKHLISLDVNLFITTNYDHVLENSFRLENYNPQVILNDRDIPSINHSRKTIVKLHGDIHSPASIVISAGDYGRYSDEHKAMSEWFRAKHLDNTILFIGTSFDDPRLKEADEHIFSLFNADRRQPYIFLKRPSSDEKDYIVALEDFKALCNNFKGRGIYVVEIENYDEINTAIKELKVETIKRKLKDNKSNANIELSLQKAYTGDLEENYRSLIDKVTLDLCESVRGYGILPDLLEGKARRDKLIEHLPKIDGTLAENSMIEALLTLSDAFLRSSETEDIRIARKYFNEANSTLIRVKNKEPWMGRMSRLQAKLLFVEGNIKEAIDLIHDSKDEKTISTWLALMIDSSNLDEAYSFVSKNTPQGRWIPEAIYVMNLTGHLTEAEKLYYSTLKKIGVMKDDKKNRELYIRSIHAAIESLFRFALKRAEKRGYGKVYLNQMDDEGLAVCRKALVYIDDFFNTNQLDILNTYFASQVKTYKLQILTFLKEYEKADAFARELVKLRPLKREVVNYIALRQAVSITSFDAEFIRQLIKILNEDYSLKYWALSIVAFFQIVILKEKENAWISIEKAVQVASQDTSIDDSERQSLAEHVFDTSIALENNENVEKALKHIESLLPESNDPWRKMIYARYLFWKKEFDIAKKEFLDILENNKDMGPELKMLCSFFLAIIYRKQGNLDEAQKLLSEADGILPNTDVLFEMLSLASLKKDDTRAMLAIEKIEAIGVKDDPKLLRAKAAVTFNLREYNKSEVSWVDLIKLTGNKPEYAIGLAHVRAVQGKYGEALKALGDYIQNDDKLNLECLKLAVNVHVANGDEGKAFEILDQNIKAILDSNNHELIMAHMSLGYKTENDDKIKDSFNKLQLLRQEGKLPEGLFEQKSIDDLIAFAKKRRESWQDLNKKYLLGQIPRYFLSNFNNNPLYLDWAYRTQNLVNFKPDLEEWSKFNTYVTNSFRVQPTKHGPNLVEITAPPDNEEVVIDYHALITLHQLGLLKQVAQRYKKIYYPEVMKNVWAFDQNEYKYHQPSRERIYRTIEERIRKGEFQEILSPQSENGNRHYEITLAQYEKIPLISAYLKDAEVPEHTKKELIRFKQVLTWIYTKGKLSETKYIEIKNIFIEEPALIDDESAYKILDNEMRFTVEQATLEAMEEYGLLTLFNEKGKKIVLDSRISNYYKRAVMEIEFSKKVGNWQKDLVGQIESINNFVSFAINTDLKVKQLSPFEWALFEPIQYAEEKGYFLLTDDRFSQMLRTKNMFNRQYGTDALLSDLYKKNIVGIDIYSESFVRMCKWRYKFLLPESTILAYFLKQYRKSPLGKDIDEIIRYFEDCMKDPGLFMGKEPTITGLPCGAKYWLTVLDRWIDALIRTWIDDEITENEKRNITYAVFKRAFPSLPGFIAQDIRNNLNSNYDFAVIQKIYLGAVNKADTKKKMFNLHELLELTFSLLNVSKERQILSIKQSLELTETEVEANDKNSRIAIAMRLLWTFYGQNLPNISIDSELVPILDKLGVIKTKNNKIESNAKFDTNKKFDENKQAFYAEQSKDIPEFVSRGPAFVHRTGDKTAEFLIPHDTISGENQEMRKATVEYISTLPYISGHTKNMVNKYEKEILNTDQVVWLPAAGKVRKQLLSDFHYASSLFLQLINVKPFNEDRVNEAWHNIFKPDIETIIGDKSINDLPLLLHNPFESLQIKERVISIIKETIKRNEGKDNLAQALDIYFENAFFIPVAGDLSPWNVVSKATTLCQLSDLQFYETIRNWTNNKNDPFSFLIAINMLLIRRSSTKDTEGVFCNEKFYEYIDSLLQFLMADTKDDVGESKDKQAAYLRWELRLIFARYYLMYLDIKSNDEIQSDKIVAIAWWMSFKIESSIYQHIMSLSPEYEFVILNLEKNIEQVKGKLSTISFEHLLKKGRPNIQPQKYYALYGEDILSSSIINMLSPTEHNLAFEGLMNPSTCLDTTLRNRILEKLRHDILHGNGQIAKVDSVISFFWDKSLCETVPILIDKYYGEAKEYLGQDRLSYLITAQEMLKPEFVNEQIKKLPEYIEKPNPAFVSLTLSSLEVYLFSHKEVPEGVSVFKNLKSFAKRISEFKDFPIQIPLSALSMILLNLKSRHKHELVDMLEKQFSELEWDKLPAEVIKVVAYNLVAIVLIGGNIDLLLCPAIKYRSEKKVREVLILLKEWLEGIFNEVPASSHENYRNILNKLIDI